MSWKILQHEDATQDCSATPAKGADFEAYNKILSEEWEVLTKAKDMISEETDDSEYRDNPLVVIAWRFGWRTYQKRASIECTLRLQTATTPSRTSRV